MRITLDCIDGELVDDFGLNATIGTVADNFSIPSLINDQNLVFGNFLLWMDVY